jgi:hypothetical protein
LKDPALIKQFLSGNYPTKEVDLGEDGVFVVKFPSGEENNQIARLAAARLNGMSRESFSIPHLVKIDRDATLDIVVSEYPDTFPSQWEKNFTNCPNEEVKNALIKAFDRFCRETEKRI